MVTGEIAARVGLVEDLHVDAGERQRAQQLYLLLRVYQKPVLLVRDRGPGGDGDGRVEREGGLHQDGFGWLNAHHELHLVRPKRFWVCGGGLVFRVGLEREEMEVDVVDEEQKEEERE
jgi:hypothetical protein